MGVEFVIIFSIPIIIPSLFTMLHNGWLSAWYCGLSHGRRPMEHQQYICKTSGSCFLHRPANTNFGTLRAQKTPANRLSLRIMDSKWLYRKPLMRQLHPTATGLSRECRVNIVLIGMRLSSSLWPNTSSLLPWKLTCSHGTRSKDPTQNFCFVLRMQNAYFVNSWLCTSFRLLMRAREGCQTDNHTCCKICREYLIELRNPVCTPETIYTLLRMLGYEWLVSSLSQFNWLRVVADFDPWLREHTQ